MMQLTYPWVLLALPLPLLAWRLLPALAANAALPVPMAVRDLMVALSGQTGRRLRNMPDDALLKGLGWLCILAAIAGPHTRDADLLTPTGRDLMIAVDLSASMDEPDMEMDGQQTSRYLVVREQLGKFIEARKGDRIGLIAYGHEAYLISPLTYDVRAVAAVLEELTIGLPGHRTDLGRAIGLAVKTFDPDQSEARVLILLSDGEDNSGELTGTDAAELAADIGVRIHTVGFASTVESDGADILREIAASTSGEFFWAKTSNDLADTSRAISDLEPVERPEEEDHIIRDWSDWFVLAALLIMATVVIREVRRA